MNQHIEAATRKAEVRTDIQERILRDLNHLRQRSTTVRQRKDITREVIVPAIRTSEEESRHIGYLPLPEQRTAARRALEGRDHRPMRVKPTYEVIDKPATVVEQIIVDKIPKAQMLVFLTVDSASFFSPEKRDLVLEQGTAALDLFSEIRERLGESILDNNFGVSVYLKIKTLAGITVRPLKDPPEDNFLTTEGEVERAKTELEERFMEAHSEVMAPVTTETVAQVNPQRVFDNITSHEARLWLVENSLFPLEENAFFYFPATIVAHFAADDEKIGMFAGKKFYLSHNEIEGEEETKKKNLKIVEEGLEQISSNRR